MPDNVTNELILEHLKSIQSKLAQGFDAGVEVKDDFWVGVLVIVIHLVWFLIHFIWTFKIYKWLFAMKYESPWASFAARFWWAASWTIFPILLFLGSG